MKRPRLLRDLGAALRQRRAAAELSRQALALRAGLSLRFVAQVEAGQGNISILKLADLAAALGTSPAALLAGAPPAPVVVALLGLRGAGKSSIGRRLARRLRVPFVELDRQVEQSAGLALSEIFALHGEDYYRRLERATLERLLAENRPMVLATGGGLVHARETYALLKRRALTVWLKARPEDHWNRVVKQGDRRPMADHPQAMAELRRILAVREPLYAEAGHTVNTAGRSAPSVLRDVASAVASARAELRA